jgi:hypothetical protein
MKLESLEEVDSRFKDISEQRNYLSQYRVYIAGKLNGMACDYIQHLRRMIVEGEKVRKEGFSIFTPGIDFLCGLVLGNWNYDDYFQNSQAWLEASHAMFVQGDDWETSNGTKNEIERAKRIEIPIFYDDIKGMKKYFIEMNKGKQTIKEIRKKCNSELTDIVTGPMNLEELSKELSTLNFHRSPESVIVMLEKRKNLKNLHGTVYITHKDFKNYK